MKTDFKYRFQFLEKIIPNLSLIPTRYIGGTS